MGRRRGFMSDALKYELARELGVHDLVAAEGWGAVPSRECGRLVQKAIEYAERSLASQRRT
jgi:small acid-soluble spore protein F (minor alpha/beta-type SASP)